MRNKISTLNIARYIANYCCEKGYWITNRRLQYLMYLVQAQFLAFRDEHTECFSDDIVAWNTGPAIPVVFREFRKHGGNPICPVSKYIERTESGPRLVFFEKEQIPENVRTEIEYVVDMFSEYSDMYIMELCKDQKPWKDAFAYGSGTIISSRAIREYFQSTNEY